MKSSKSFQNEADEVTNTSKMSFQGMAKRCRKIFESNFLLQEKHVKDLGRNELMKVGDP